MPTVVQFSLAGRKGGGVDAQPFQPYIILILADDLVYEIPGLNKNNAYSTPNLDALANAGNAILERTFNVRHEEIYD